MPSAAPSLSNTRSPSSATDAVDGDGKSSRRVGGRIRRGRQGGLSALSWYRQRAALRSRHRRPRARLPMISPPGKEGAITAPAPLASTSPASPRGLGRRDDLLREVLPPRGVTTGASSNPAAWAARRMQRRWRRGRRGGAPPGSVVRASGARRERRERGLRGEDGRRSSPGGGGGWDGGPWGCGRPCRAGS